MVVRELKSDLLTRKELEEFRKEIGEEFRKEIKSLKKQLAEIQQALKSQLKT